MRPQSIRNDKDAIISIVAELYTADDASLRQASFSAFENKPRDVTIIHYGAWAYAYDRRNNVIYVKYPEYS